MLMAVDLSDKRALIIGAGKIGYHKACLALAAGADVTVIAPHFSVMFKQLDTQIAKIVRPYQPTDLQHADLIFACTDQPALNAEIAAAVGEHQWVNDVSNRHHSNFTNVARYAWQDQEIGVASTTRNFRQSIVLRDKIAAWLAGRANG